MCLSGSKQLPDDEPGKDRGEAADLAQDEQGHRHLGFAVRVFELVDGVAPYAVADIARDSPDEENTTTIAAVRLTRAGQALNSTKTASKRVANE